MSHIVTIRTRVRDPIAVAAACRRLRLDAPVEGVGRLFAGSVQGLCVRLPGWRYPVVIEPAEGRLHYDHFGGAWGDPTHLDRFLQMYAVEKTRLEARKQGHTILEHNLPDGSIRLTLQPGT